MGQKLFKRDLVLRKHLRTSIGNSANSRPTNKNKRRLTKTYKGQGK